MTTYTVKIELEARNKKQIEKWLDNCPMDIFRDEIVDPDEKHYEERIRYDENWHGHGEHFVFEGKWSDEDKWGTDIAFKLFDYDKDGVHETGSLINYRALTKIRELKRMGIDFRFGQ